MTNDTAQLRPAGTDGASSSLIRAVLKRWWLVVLLVVISVGVALAAQANRTPTYSSEAQILITPLTQNDSPFLGIRLLRDSGDAARDLQTAVTLLSSPQIASRTAQRVGRGYDLAAVQSDVAVDAVGGSNVVSVTATAGSPEVAQALANAYAESAVAVRNAQVSEQAKVAMRSIDGKDGDAFVAQREQLRTLRDRGDPTVSQSQAAPLPTTPDGPASWLIVAIAVLAGLTLATIAALLLERGDRRVRDRAELLQRLPVPVLSAVPAPPRGHSGIDMPPAIREAFRTLQIQLDLRERRACRKILVTSPSSGDGKTTTVLNLAFALISAGHRVIIIDFDLRKPDLERQIGLEPSSGLVESLTSGAPLAQIMRSAPLLAPLRVVPVTAKPGDVALLPALARRMQSLLVEAEALADYVIIDTAPLGEVGDALSIVEYADDVLVVGRPGATDRSALDAMAGLLQRAGIVATGWVVANADTPSARYHEDLDGPAKPRRRRAPVA